MPECEKLKMVGYTSMAKCKALTGSAVKGLSSPISKHRIIIANWLSVEKASVTTD